ncbi:MAG: hypothetical protein A4S09_01225 [Proteobacteria bacterium SG_bin7]|nr:MAG: hypothetical protein A4S09_01225 [Proteobacteria bacterium SG_bin7]
MNFSRVFRPLKMTQGLSLIEALLATGVMMAILFSSADFITFYVKKNRELRAITESKVEMQMVRDYLRVAANQVGGGTVRPWMAVWVENNCALRVPFPACNGSDRVTMASRDFNLNTCFVTSATVGNTLNFDPVAGVNCCSNTHFQKPIVVSKTGYWAQFFVDAVVSTPLTCSVHVVNGQGSGINAQASPPRFTDWGGASVDVIEVSTYYLNTVTHELRVFTDLNNNSVIDPNEDQLIGANIYDFQIVLGYDAAPTDGIVSDSGTQADEWLFNFTGPQEALGVAGGGLATANFTNLRAIGFGLMSGGSALGGSATLLNGPLRTDPKMKLVTAVEKIYFQSSLYFQ